MPDTKSSQYTMRSMQTDLEALAGKGPAEKAVAVPQVAPKPPSLSQAMPPPNLPHEAELPKPAAPAPARPLPPKPQEPLPPKTGPAGPTMRNLAAEPTRPAGPSPLSSRPKPPAPPMPPKVSAPQAPRAKMGKRVPILIFGALLIVLLIGVEVWWFFIRPDATEPLTRPDTGGLIRPEDTLPTGIDEPPTPTGEQPAVAEPLLGYAETDTITLSGPDAAAVVAALNSAVAETRTSGRPTRLVFLVPAGNVQRELTWTEISSALQLSIPSSVQAQLSGAYNLFVMPKTTFDDETCKGQQQGCAGPRLGLALSATDSAALQNSVRSWETTMVQDLRHLIVANISGETRPFLNASYRGVEVRYRNLPLPSVTIDYALTQQKLIITTSKSLMFAALDSL